MSLYVHYRPENGLPKQIKQRPASPGEALQYALTCRTCGGSSEIRVVERGPVERFVPCIDCIDGIPRWAIETVARAIFSQRITGVKKPAPFGTFRDDEQYRVKAKAVLVALRDREE